MDIWSLQEHFETFFQLLAALTARKISKYVIFGLIVSFEHLCRAVEKMFHDFLQQTPVYRFGLASTLYFVPNQCKFHSDQQNSPFTRPLSFTCSVPFYFKCNIIVNT